MRLGDHLRLPLGLHSSWAMHLLLIAENVGRPQQQIRNFNI